MTDRVKKLLELLKSEEYKERRHRQEIILPHESENLSDIMRDARIFERTLQCEEPYLFENERIGFNRSNTAYYETVNKNGKLFTPWALGNIVPDYETALNRGMEALRSDIEERLEGCTPAQREFYNAALVTVDAALSFADRCAENAKKAGAEELYLCLCRVPRKGARTLLEACVFMKFIIFTLRCNRNTHITLGRFDKYMRPFYYADLRAGKTRAELLEITEEFFISINIDTDLYQGVQKGDNGQSLVMGGCGSFDDFSHLCMEASLELNLIDPKINLRVDKNTPDELYEFATLMTKQGLGFPQYCNDDVVIPGLTALGYSREDAEDYAVAACWEFIIPAKGLDVPNIEFLNYPKVIAAATRERLEDSQSFEEFLQTVKEYIRAECNRLTELKKNFRYAPSPYKSLFVRSCIEQGKDLSDGGAVYNNYGFHGAGIATAADSLAAINEVIFETKEYTKGQLLEAIDKNFEGYGEMRNRLLSCPKMGNCDGRVDSLAYMLMDTFSEGLKGKTNCFGGIFRAGTGSAQGYYYEARGVGATADGRRAGDPYGSSYSPSLEARINGPLSCIKSFAGYDLKKTINGGPLTLEIHDTVFRNGEGIKKVAALVKAFIMLGGHQLQLNSVNRDILLDAMAHPENHKNLIVRVWGWSGYFNELDLPFKEHIIKRTEYTV